MKTALGASLLLWFLIGAVVHKQMHTDSSSNQPVHLGGEELAPKLQETPVNGKKLESKPANTSEEQPRTVPLMKRKRVLAA